MIKIIICDDHPLISEGLTSFLNSKSDIDVLAIASSIKQLKEILEKCTADILILDINLPDGSGADFSAEIKANYPDLKILALTNLDDTNIIRKMFNNGASGFVLKSEPMAEIEIAIRLISAGKIYMSQEVQMSLIKTQNEQKTEIPLITKREKEVLKFLISGLSTPEIAEKMSVGTETVSSHRKSLLQKFDVNRTVLLIQKAQELGFN